MAIEDKKLFWTSDMVDPKIRDENYRAISGLLYDVSPLNINREHGLEGGVGSRAFGNMTLAVTSFNDQKYQRSQKLVSYSGMELYLVQLVLAGQATGDFNGNNVAFNAGDILITDLTQVMVAHSTTGARLAVVIARADVQRLLPGRNLHGVVLKADLPTTRLLAQYLIGLEKVLADLPDDAVPPTQEALLLLLTSALKGENNRYDYMPVNVPMRQRIIDFIDANISDPKLGVQLITTQFRVSRSHLYRMFEEDDGIASLIREKRLDLAYRLLSNQKPGRLSIKAVVHRCGFAQSTNFSKMFKERFGVLPADAREQRILLPKQNATPQELHTSLLSSVVKLSGLQQKMV